MNSRRFGKLDPSRDPGSRITERLAAERQREELRWRRDRAIGTGLAVVLHFLILILARDTIVPSVSEPAAAGPAMGDFRPAGGGSGLTMINISVAPPQPTVVETPVPVPVPVPEPPEVEVPEPEEEVVATPEPPSIAPPSQVGVGGPGTGGQGGTTTGPGTGSGDGLGGGGTGDGGGPSQIIPPTPRGIFIPPPGRPASARGQEITVWVFVSAAGRVDRNTVRLEPPTSDSRYNQRLIQSVAEWVFDPARQDGRAVPVWYPFQIIL